MWNSNTKKLTICKIIKNLMRWIEIKNEMNSETFLFLFSQLFVHIMLLLFFRTLFCHVVSNALLIKLLKWFCLVSFPTFVLPGSYFGFLPVTWRACRKIILFYFCVMKPWWLKQRTWCGPLLFVTLQRLFETLNTCNRENYFKHKSPRSSLIGRCTQFENSAGIWNSTKLS